MIHTKVTRRRLLATMASASALGCTKKSQWTPESEWTEDGAFRTGEDCTPTASNIEGPYYINGAPQRSDLRVFGDDGVEVTLRGRVFTGDCSVAMQGAKIEFWQANPMGEYDNTSEQMRYRCVLYTDRDGAYTLQTLLSGLYKNGALYRPHHIHVRVWDSLGVERLTTQLYFEGDPYLPEDSFAHESLVMSFAGSLTTSISAQDVDFIV